MLLEKFGYYIMIVSVGFNNRPKIFEKKEKFVMETKKITPEDIADAAARLNNALTGLEEAIEIKNREIKDREQTNLQAAVEKDKQNQTLKAASERALRNMESIINKLNSVLETDGSGNNNN